MSTTTDKRKTEEKVLEKNLRYRKALLTQLREFNEDESYFELYEPYEFEFSDYLVRLFKFYPPEEFRPKTSIIVPSELVGGDPVRSQHIYSEVVMPIAKVIKVGHQVEAKEAKRYPAGTLVHLPPSKVLGWDWNPEFLHAHQFSQSNLSLLTEMDQKLRRLDIHYEIFRFTRLGNLYADEQDKLTFLLPSVEIKGSYKI